MISRLFIRKHERALQFARGDFRRLLGPGAHVRVPVWEWLRGVRTERVNLLETRFQHKMLAVLVKEPALQGALHVVDLTDAQRALVWKDGRLEAIVGPGLHAFWREPFDVKVEVFDVREEGASRGAPTGARDKVDAARGADPEANDATRSGELRHERLDAVLAHADAARFLRVVEAAPYHEVLVFRNAELVARVAQGRFVLWVDRRPVTVRDLDLREQTADVAGQEIMTRDKVTLRVNLVVTWQVTDALAAVAVTGDLDKALYRESQLVLRAALGGRSLDALLSDKEAVGGEVEREIQARAKAYGVVVKSVGIRDVVLPGEMKTILNQVILAEKQAEANLIKRREETAAARSQANTARLLAENPILARMKELESLQEILAGAKATFVFGREGIAGQIRGLLKEDAEGGGG